MNYSTTGKPHERSARLRPLPQAYFTLRLVSRQIQLEVSPFLFKDKILVLACDAEEAYRNLVQIPSDVLKHIKVLRFHELILLGNNHQNRTSWLRIANFIAKQMKLREVIVQVPNDPTFPDAFDDEDSNNTLAPDLDEDEADAELEALKLKRYQQMIRAWIGFWWPGVKLLLQLLTQKKIANCIKLRHESKDYLDRCGIKDAAGLDELKSIAELRYPYDCLLDESWLKGAATHFEDLLDQGSIDQEVFDWYKRLMNTHPDRELLDFDRDIGVDDDGYQVVVLKRKTMQGPKNGDGRK
jgi:hypothetical protein